MYASPVLLALRRHPKRNTFIGVHWTQWPWPSLVLQAMYRKYGPKPDPNSSEAYRRSAYHRLAILYMGVCWSAFGVAIFWWYRKDWDNHYRVAKEEGNEALPTNLYFATRLVDKYNTLNLNTNLSIHLKRRRRVAVNLSLYRYLIEYWYKGLFQFSFHFVAETTSRMG